MTSFRILDRKGRQIVAAVALSVATVVPTLVPALASAAQLSERSVSLSSSSKTATGVSYAFDFTATGSAGAVLVEFCSNTPLIGEDCTDPSVTPGGFTAAGAGVTGGVSASLDGTPTANKVILADTISAGDNSFTLTGITNPSTAGTIYARILTYATTGAAESYTSDTPGTHVDDGSVAISITDSVGVSGAVLETMTFCVSGGQDAAHPEINPITADCGGTLTAPSLKLGKDTSGVIALASDAVYSGTIYTQISTNAVKGAVVSLKSSALNCGGLIRSSDPTACDIGPSGIDSNTVTAGTAGFGVKTGAVDTDADGTVQPGTNYSSSLYHMNYVAGNASGVTSTYGDPIFDTDEAPANNKDMPLTFGASIANNTPAGNYSADLSLIATGKF